MGTRGVFVAASLVAFAAGCGRTVTEDDCVKIKDNMREAWAAEAKKAAPVDSAAADAASRALADKAGAVVKSEGERLVTDWMAECRRDLIGRRAEPREMDCLLQAKSIAQITKCSE